MLLMSKYNVNQQTASKLQRTEQLIVLYEFTYLIANIKVV